jgi:hypothetical protein
MASKGEDCLTFRSRGSNIELMHQKGGSFMFKKVFGTILLVVFMFPIAALALDYSADIMNVEVIGKEKETTKAKGYFSKDKWRSEAETDEGEKAITIFRLDKEVLWILMPEQKMYMEQKIPMEKFIEAASQAMKELEEEKKIKVYRKIVGKEKISGILCNKHKITVKDFSEKKTRTYTMYQWISVKHKELIMKTAFEGGSYTQLKNVKFKKQPASLFEIPKGYKKFTMDQMMRMDVEEGEEVGEEVEEEVEEEDVVEEQIKEQIKEEFKMEMPIELPF